MLVPQIDLANLIQKTNQIGGMFHYLLKFIYSKKATKFCEIIPLLLTVCTVVKIKGKISQNFVAFSDYMNFNIWKLFSYIVGGGKEK